MRDEGKDEAGRQVLIVDDDVDVCDAYSEVLREAGFGVRCAHNGRDALCFLRDAHRVPTLILLDLMMPIMDGWQLNAELKQIPTLSAVPVVVLTAGRRQPPIRATEVLQKPVSLEVLLAAVERHARLEHGA